MQMTADFPTARGASLLATLSKHFANKIEVTTADDHAALHFEMGLARIAVAPQGLHLVLEAPDPAAMEPLRDVVERHLLRFAHREDPAPLDWSQAAQA